MGASGQTGRQDQRQTQDTHQVARGRASLDQSNCAPTTHHLVGFIMSLEDDDDDERLAGQRGQSKPSGLPGVRPDTDMRGRKSAPSVSGCVNGRLASVAGAGAGQRPITVDIDSLDMRSPADCWPGSNTKISSTGSQQVEPVDYMTETSHDNELASLSSCSHSRSELIAAMQAAQSDSCDRVESIIQGASESGKQTVASPRVELCPSICVASGQAVICCVGPNPTPLKNNNNNNNDNHNNTGSSSTQVGSVEQQLAARPSSARSILVTCADEGSVITTELVENRRDFDKSSSTCIDKPTDQLKRLITSVINSMRWNHNITTGSGSVPKSSSGKIQSRSEGNSRAGQKFGASEPAKRRQEAKTGSDDATKTGSPDSAASNLICLNPIADSRSYSTFKVMNELNDDDESFDLSSSLKCDHRLIVEGSHKPEVALVQHQVKQQALQQGKSNSGKDEEGLMGTIWRSIKQPGATSGSRAQISEDNNNNNNNCKSNKGQEMEPKRKMIQQFYGSLRERVSELISGTLGQTGNNHETTELQDNSQIRSELNRDDEMGDHHEPGGVCSDVELNERKSILGTSDSCQHTGGGGLRLTAQNGAADLEAAKGYKKRDIWGKNIEFLLAVIGFAVDLGNIWRFPLVCYKNGGGAFLIPYTILFVLGGLPIFYLEMSLGQYFSSGCLTVWKRVCPIAKGIGYSMCMLNFFTGLYYNTIISWAVFFFVESFKTNLPWTSCQNSWNTDGCMTLIERSNYVVNHSDYSSMDHQQEQSMLKYSQENYTSPTEDYFDREVLRKHLSTGIDDLGQIRTPLALYLAVVFICIYFAIWKGVKSTGKAVWITALLPYFILVPLLFRGIFLDGAWSGIKYYLSPQWSSVRNLNVWVEAAKQIYFSLGPGFGTLMALSSYNKFHHNICRDALIAASVNYFASFIAGFVIFAVLGYMSEMGHVDISKVATEGPGLVFQVYPEGLATMQFSPFWSVLFFTMVITLGIDSTFGGLESVITGLCDEYPRVLRAHRGIFIGILIVIIYLCSLPTTTYGGHHVIFILESYGTSSLLLIVLIETIIVCWVYGTERFCSNLQEMSGKRPSIYWRICWKYISPSILLIIIMGAFAEELEKYHILRNNDYVYPDWAPKLGLLITVSSIICIPVYAIYHLAFKTTGSLRQRLVSSIRPEVGLSEGQEIVITGKLN